MLHFLPLLLLQLLNCYLFYPLPRRGGESRQRGLFSLLLLQTLDTLRQASFPDARLLLQWVPLLPLLWLGCYGHIAMGDCMSKRARVLSTSLQLIFPTLLIACLLFPALPSPTESRFVWLAVPSLLGFVLLLICLRAERRPAMAKARLRVDHHGRQSTPFSPFPGVKLALLVYQLLLLLLRWGIGYFDGIGSWWEGFAERLLLLLLNLALSGVVLWRWLEKEVRRAGGWHE